MVAAHCLNCSTSALQSIGVVAVRGPVRIEGGIVAVRGPVGSEGTDI